MLRQQRTVGQSAHGTMIPSLTSKGQSLMARIVKSAWLSLSGILVLFAALCCGCSDTTAHRRGVDAGLPINLRDLVMIYEVGKDPISGIHNRQVFHFHSRETGDAVNVGDLIIRGDDGTVIVGNAFSEGLAVASYGRGIFGYVDVTGRMVIPFKFTDADQFRGGRARVVFKNEDDEEQAGLIDRSGKWVVPPGRYDDLGQFREGCCAFRVGKKWGLLDAAGKEVVAPRFANPPTLHCGLAAITSEDGAPSYIDRHGQVKVRGPAKAITGYDFHDGVAWFTAGGPQRGDEDFSELFPEAEALYGLISLTGHVIVPPTYTRVDSFSEGLAVVSRDAEIRFRDDREPMEFYFEGSKEGPWGYIDVTGAVVIPLRFERAGRFSCGLARVRQDGKWGYIDKSGDWVIRPRFSWARDFRDGIAEVWYQDKTLFIDRTGATVIDAKSPAVTF